MTEHVVLTRKETLKLVNTRGVAGSNVSVSRSCFFVCSLCRVSWKRTLEHLLLSLEVLEP